MAVTVIVRSGGGGAEPSLSITRDEPMLVIGRGEGCDVQLPDPSVTHRHATLKQRGRDYVLVDEGSTNGTFLRGMRLGTLAPQVVQSGDLVRVGRVWLQLVVAPFAACSDATAAREVAMTLVERALTAQLAERAELPIAGRQVVSEALRELEQMPDERMRGDEPVAPPQTDTVSTGRGSRMLIGTEAEPIDGVDGKASGPIASGPRAGSSAPSTGVHQGRRAPWHVTEWMALIVAAVVLAMSAGGLYWLFRAP